MILGPFSTALASAATRHLGEQWRYEAALSEDHELIQTGPYRWLRHPIYTSTLLLLVAAGLAWTWWPMLVAALVFFRVGT
jgi:protein-S-isoprenylcysteine O-methyltransferase Ste14